MLSRQAVLYFVILAGAFENLGMYMSVTAMSYLVVSMGGHATLTGTVQATLAFSAIMFGPFVGRAVDKYGPRIMLLYGMFGHAIGHGAVAIAPNFKFLLAARFLHGIFFSATTPSCLKYIAVICSENEERAYFMSRQNIGSSTAELLAPALAVLLMSLGSPRNAYMGGSILCFVLAIVALIALPPLDAVQSSASKSSAIGETKTAGPTTDTTTDTTTKQEERILPPTRWCSLAFLVFGLFTVVAGLHPLFTVVTPQYIQKELNWGPRVFGAVLIQNATISLLFQWLLYVRLNKAIGSIQSALLAVCIETVALAGYAIVPYMGSFAAPTFVVAQLMKSLASAFGITASYQSITEVVHPNEVGLGSSYGSMAGSAARLIGPPLFGALFDFVSDNAPYMVASALCLVGALFFWGAKLSEDRASKTRKDALL